MINLILILIVGGLIGWIASIVMRTNAQQGVLLNIVVGIVGALLAGFLLAPLFGTGTITQGNFSLPALLVSLLGDRLDKVTVVDKSFVLGMGSDLSDLAVVRAIVDLGHSLSLSVVAEGVEEDAVRHQLAEMGCDVAQGYLFSRPLHERRFEAWLRARTVQMPGLRDDETVQTLVH